MVQRTHRWAEAGGQPAGQMDHEPERLNSRGEEQMGEALRREGGGVEIPERLNSRGVYPHTQGLEWQRIEPRHRRVVGHDI